MAMSKRIRYEVMRRDNFTCRYCRSTENSLTVDHVTPVSLGGSDDPGNLVAACKDCNAGKSSSNPTNELIAQVEEDQMRWAKAIAAAAQIRARNLDAQADYLNTFHEVWGPRYMPSAAQGTLRKLYESGLPIEDLHQAAMLAIGARNVESRFAYFSGIAWRRVTDLQNAARKILAEEGRV